MDQHKWWAYDHDQGQEDERHHLNYTQICIARGSRTATIVMFAIVSCMAITNAYIYLYKQGMYKSFPLIATYVVTFLLCSTSIFYQFFMMTCGTDDCLYPTYLRFEEGRVDDTSNSTVTTMKILLKIKQ